MPKTKKDDSLHFRSIALGIVAGLTLTAVVVTIQSFIGLTEQQIQNAYRFGDLRMLISGTRPELEEDPSSNGFWSLHEIESLDTSDWEEYTDENFGFKIMHPANWDVTQTGVSDCTADSAQSECYTVLITDSVTGEIVVVSTSEDYISSPTVSRFPGVGYVTGEEMITDQYRHSDCSTETDDFCPPAAADKSAELMYTTYFPEGTNLTITSTGSTSLTQAVIVNSFLLE